MLRIAARAFLGALVLATVVPGVSTAETPSRVFVVVIDGLQPEDVTPALTPNLSRFASDGEARQYENADAIMVTETNANHTAMMTGVWGETSGLVANGFFNTKTGEEESLDRPELILVDTLFDRLDGPDWKTASVMGKAKLRSLFDCTRDGSGSCGPSSKNPEDISVEHVRPDFHFGANESLDPEAILAGEDAPAEPASGSGYAVDNHVMAQVIRLSEVEDPDFTFVNLGGVDGIQHLFGAKSVEGRAAVANADLLVGLLVEYLRLSGKWDDSLVIVTSDHSFQSTGDPVRATTPPTPVGEIGLEVANPLTPQVTGTYIPLDEALGTCTNGTEFAVATHGGSASLYITDDDYDAYAGDSLTPAQHACLAELADKARSTPNVDEALYRFENPNDPGQTVAANHPDWNLDSPRAGELLLTATDAALFGATRTSTAAVVTGNHGGPTARPIPFLMLSGSDSLATGVDATNEARPIDVAPTVAALLGATLPGVDGRILCEAIDGLCP